MKKIIKNGFDTFLGHCEQTKCHVFIYVVKINNLFAKKDSPTVDCSKDLFIKKSLAL